MLIVITGTPGTGKSAVARELGRILKFPVIDVKGIAERKRIATKNKNGERIVDAEKLKKALLLELKKYRNAIIENHLLCEFSIPADFVFVLRTNPETLQRRLIKRKYTKKKLDENLVSEMLDYCVLKVRKNYGFYPPEIDTSLPGPKETAAKIAFAARHKKRRVDKVDYTGYLKKYMGLK